MGGAESPGPVRTSESPARALRHRNFRLLWVGSVTSAAGASIGSIVVVWLVYFATRSPLAISLLGVVQFLPTLLFGILAGALIDRWDRRRLMLACDVARAICFGALALFVLFYGANTLVLIGVVFAVAAFSTAFRPATNATVPRLLPSAEVMDGNGLLQGGSTTASFLGSPFGGVLVVTVGAVVGLALNAFTFAISAAMIFLMVIPTAPSASSATGSPRRSLLAAVVEGFRFLRSQRALLLITLTAMVANFFLAIWGGFTVIYAAVQLHQGAEGFGILVAANTAGFAIGAILPGRLRTDRAPGIWLIASWGLVGFFILGLAFTSSLLLAVPLTLVAGALLSIGNTTWLSGVQRTVPDEYLGRYFATDEAGSFAMIPLGIAVGGLLVVFLGISVAYIIAAAGGGLINLVLVFSPAVRRWGREVRPSGSAPTG
ncbi:MAG TPA: MFS transporter [Thermoplasmata archaeon]|nr:MFS transporter [Thermoplasmata archaeon]